MATKLLTVSGKTAKTVAAGIVDAALILYLPPGSKNVCPNATPGCKAACFGSKALGSFRFRMDSVSQAQKRRLDLWQTDPVRFREQLGQELVATFRKLRKGRDPANPPTVSLRLNGTSDIEWPIELRQWIDGLARSSGVRLIQYEYSKKPPEQWPDDGVDRTYSASERDSIERIQELVGKGIRVAVPFNLPRNADIGGLTWNGVYIVDGDQHDATFVQPKGVVVALRQKGIAKSAQHRGFVREAEFTAAAGNVVP